jgi:hypothetical protein
MRSLRIADKRELIDRATDYASWPRLAMIRDQTIVAIPA